MKIKYFATLATASILSLGLVTACGNPCAAKTKSSPSSSPTEATDPCAGVPCAGKNACAGKNPCAGVPCAGK